MATKTDSRQDSSGWRNICLRQLAPGVYCAQPYWYVARSGKRLDPDMEGEHICRVETPS